MDFQSAMETFAEAWVAANTGKLSLNNINNNVSESNNNETFGCHSTSTTAAPAPASGTRNNNSSVNSSPCQSSSKMTSVAETLSSAVVPCNKPNSSSGSTSALVSVSAIQPLQEIPGVKSERSSPIDTGVVGDETVKPNNTEDQKQSGSPTQLQAGSGTSNSVIKMTSNIPAPGLGNSGIDLSSRRRLSLSTPRRHSTNTNTTSAMTFNSSSKYQETTQNVGFSSLPSSGKSIPIHCVVEGIEISNSALQPNSLRQQFQNRASGSRSRSQSRSPINGRNICNGLPVNNNTWEFGKHHLQQQQETKSKVSASARKSRKRKRKRQRVKTQQTQNPDELLVKKDSEADSIAAPAATEMEAESKESDSQITSLGNEEGLPEKAIEDKPGDNDNQDKNVSSDRIRSRSISDSETEAEEDSIDEDEQEEVRFKLLEDLQLHQRTVIEVDDFIIIPSGTPFYEVVPTVLSLLGYSKDSIYHAEGLISIRNWKPLHLSQICDCPQKTVGDIFNDLTNHATLRILITRSKRGNLSCCASATGISNINNNSTGATDNNNVSPEDLKEKLLRLLLKQSSGVLFGGRSNSGSRTATAADEIAPERLQSNSTEATTGAEEGTGRTTRDRSRDREVDSPQHQQQQQQNLPPHPLLLEEMTKKFDLWYSTQHHQTINALVQSLLQSEIPATTGTTATGASLSHFDSSPSSSISSVESLDHNHRSSSGRRNSHHANNHSHQEHEEEEDEGNGNSSNKLLSSLPLSSSDLIATVPNSSLSSSSVLNGLKRSRSKTPILANDEQPTAAAAAVVSGKHHHHHLSSRYQQQQSPRHLTSPASHQLNSNNNNSNTQFQELLHQQQQRSQQQPPSHKFFLDECANELFAAAAAGGGILPSIPPHHHLLGPPSAQLQLQSTSAVNTAAGAGLNHRHPVFHSFASQKTRMRTSFDPEMELPKLQQWFAENPHPSRQQIQQYVRDLNTLDCRKDRKPLDVNNVIYWFKNARAAQKRNEQRYNGIPGSSNTGQSSGSLQGPGPSMVPFSLSQFHHHQQQQQQLQHYNSYKNSNRDRQLRYGSEDEDDDERNNGNDFSSVSEDDHAAKRRHRDRHLSDYEKRSNDNFGQANTLTPPATHMKEEYEHDEHSHDPSDFVRVEVELTEEQRNSEDQPRDLTSSSNNSKDNHHHQARIKKESDPMLNGINKEKIEGDYGNNDRGSNLSTTSPTASLSPRSLSPERGNELSPSPPPTGNTSNTTTGHGHGHLRPFLYGSDGSIRVRDRDHGTTEDHLSPANSPRHAQLSPPASPLTSYSSAAAAAAMLNRFHPLFDHPSFLAYHRHFNSFHFGNPNFPQLSSATAAAAASSHLSPGSEQATRNNAASAGAYDPPTPPSRKNSSSGFSVSASASSRERAAAAAAEQLFPDFNLIGNHLRTSSGTGANTRHGPFNPFGSPPPQNSSVSSRQIPSSSAELISSIINSSSRHNHDLMAAAAAGIVGGGSVGGNNGHRNTSGGGAHLHDAHHNHFHHHRNSSNNNNTLGNGSSISALSGIPMGVVGGRPVSPSSVLSAALQDERRKRNRTFIDPVTEVPRLEQWFSLNTHPSHNLILKYTDELNRMPYRQKFPRLEPKNVQFWFKNRRAKCKRLKMTM